MTILYYYNTSTPVKATHMLSTLSLSYNKQRPLGRTVTHLNLTLLTKCLPRL